MRRREPRSSYQYLYDRAFWKRRRAAQLGEHPLCEWCQARGVTRPATTVHHATRHNGDVNVFMLGPLVSLCKRCHDSDAQRIEHGRQPRPWIGVDGLPVEPGDQDDLC
jgi:hypothetical protein